MHAVNVSIKDKLFNLSGPKVLTGFGKQKSMALKRFKLTKIVSMFV